MDGQDVLTFLMQDVKFFRVFEERVQEDGAITASFAHWHQSSSMGRRTRTDSLRLLEHSDATSFPSSG